MMVVSKYGFYDNSRWDASRVASQVVSGVGFLGAGVIFVRNNLVSGLTTSAGMWATAGVGLAMGAGMYVVGLLGSHGCGDPVYHPQDFLFCKCCDKRLFANDD
ncbi:MAG: MgtC/SapB family protein [Lachnospiraceae bacterium]